MPRGRAEFESRNVGLHPHPTHKGEGIMFNATPHAPAAHGDPSALDALLEAEREVGLDLQRAEREAERLMVEARAAAAAADEQAERELRHILQLLDEQAATQRVTDANAVRAEADRRARLFAEADDVTIAAIAERLLTVVAPAAPVS